jgi:hypothetical protein
MKAAGTIILPLEAINAKSVNSFKTNYDNFIEKVV